MKEYAVTVRARSQLYSRLLSDTGVVQVETTLRLYSSHKSEVDTLDTLSPVS